VRILGFLIISLGLLQGQEAFERFFDDYYFRYAPTAGTAAGFHQYDSKLEDYSKETVQERIAALHQFETQFEKLPASADRDLVLGFIRGSLLELETIRQWQTNPDVYSSGITSSAFVMISRKFAPAEQRLQALIARERQMPAVFGAARANLKNPPKIYTEVAIEQLPGIIRFFQNDVPLAFQKVQDSALTAEFRKTNQSVIDALAAYQKFLKDDLLPRSNGDFRIGAENYRKKLQFDEMVDTPVDELLKIGYANLRQNQDAFRETGKKIDARKTPAQILTDLQKDHPPADQLLQSFRDVLAGLRDFIVKHKIIDLPSPAPPTLEETPPFMRALTTASMDTAGPYERVAKEAFFNVTLPEKDWPKERTEQLLESFNRGTIISTSIHEAYPGHYVQFLWVPRVESKVRKLLGAGSNSEGWAHYCEQMMLEEGYGGGDSKLRLGQLQDALLRNARYIVGIQMHTGKMTFDQGVDFFVKEGYQTRELAEVETKRGTSDPTYLVYTLGKLEILKLREDYKKMRGPSFNLEEFHDSFMKQGFPPIKIVRRALLGNDSPVL
jgi:uncharacterized protein (DUF885 family)